jgi:hypothetical protein
MACGHYPKGMCLRKAQVQSHRPQGFRMDDLYCADS